MKVLDKGFVELEAFGPSDPELMVVNSARVSFAKHVTKVSKADIGLIGFLLKNRHGTPFEMAEFWFHVKAPIFVVREWHRHRIASYNEMSGRYTELRNEFYVPDGANVRTQVGKPGAYHYEELDDLSVKTLTQDTIKRNQQDAWSAYQLLLDNGIAKEQARIVLPVSIYTEFYYKTNARSLMNFLSLRNSKHAMFEIREYAQAMEDMFKAIMPYTHGAFVLNGRISP